MPGLTQGLWLFELRLRRYTRECANKVPLLTVCLIPFGNYIQSFTLKASAKGCDYFNNNQEGTHLYVLTQHFIN